MTLNRPGRAVPVIASILLPACYSQRPVALARRQPAPPADTSALSRFWAVADTLAAGRAPSAELWQALAMHPAYAQIERQGRRVSVLRRCMPLVFSPGRQRALDSVTATTGTDAYVCRHLAAVKRRRAELTAFLRTVDTRALVAAAREMAQTYLPAGATDRFELPTVYLALFEPGGFGGNAIVLDLLAVMDRDTGRNVGLLAHELHHAYRSRIARPRRDFGDDMLAWRLETTEEEGTAGLLDKGDIPGMTDEQLRAAFVNDDVRRYYADYRDEYKRSNEWIARTTELLVRASRSPDSAATLGRKLAAELPDNGRIMGAFMAAHIERVFGRDSVVVTVGDPLRFWTMYDAAAKARPGTALPLGTEALHAIAAILGRYEKPAR